MTHPTARIDTLCAAVNVGHVGPSSMHRDPNGVPFIMGKNVGFGFIDTDDMDRVTEQFHRSQPKSQIRAGDVLVVRIGKSGQASKVPESLGEANCSGLVIIKQPQKINADYLVYFLNSPMGRMQSLSQARGSTRLTLNTASVASTMVPVPPPAEQRRVVGFLDKALAAIATAKANIEKNVRNARVLFQSQLQSVFSRQYAGSKKRALGEVCDLQNGFAFKSTDYIECSDTLNIRMSSIRPGGNFDPEHNKRFLPDSFARDFSDFLLNDGDLIIAMTDMASDPKILGIPTLVQNRHGRNFLMNQRVGKLCELSPDVLAPYLRYVLSTPGVREFYRDKGAGGLQVNISKGDILSAQIPIPRIAEQKTIVAQLDHLANETQRLESLYRNELTTLETLQKSLLREAFTGAL